MTSKKFSEEALLKDLNYLVQGIDCHYILALARKPEPGIKVLEPGCGSGKLGLRYAMRGAQVVLLDIDPGAIYYTTQLGKKLDSMFEEKFLYETVLGSVLELPFPDNTFDFVFNEGVPHHFGYEGSDTRREKCFQEMARVTKSKGVVCVIGSNAHCPAIVEMAEKTEHTYMEMPKRQKPFTRVELIQQLQDVGLVGIKCMPVSSSSWSDSFLIAGWGVKP